MSESIFNINFLLLLKKISNNILLFEGFSLLYNELYFGFKIQLKQKWIETPSFILHFSMLVITGLI